MKVFTDEPTVTLLRRHAEALLDAVEQAIERANQVDRQNLALMDGREQLQVTIRRLSDALDALEHRLEVCGAENENMRAQVHDYDMALAEADAYIASLQADVDDLRGRVER